MSTTPHSHKYKQDNRTPRRGSSTYSSQTNENINKQWQQETIKEDETPRTVNKCGICKKQIDWQSDGLKKLETNSRQHMKEYKQTDAVKMIQCTKLWKNKVHGRQAGDNVLKHRLSIALFSSAISTTRLLISPPEALLFPLPIGLLTRLTYHSSANCRVPVITFLYIYLYDACIYFLFLQPALVIICSLVADGFHDEGKSRTF